jgi:hypothetical protein
MPGLGHGFERKVPRVKQHVFANQGWYGVTPYDSADVLIIAEVELVPIEVRDEPEMRFAAEAGDRIVPVAGVFRPIDHCGDAVLTVDYDANAGLFETIANVGEASREQHEGAEERLLDAVERTEDV